MKAEKNNASYLADHLSNYHNLQTVEGVIMDFEPMPQYNLGDTIRIVNPKTKQAEVKRIITAASLEIMQHEMRRARIKPMSRIGLKVMTHSGAFSNNYNPANPVPMESPCLKFSCQTKNKKSSTKCQTGSVKKCMK